jgi:VWFA-related protein
MKFFSRFVAALALIAAAQPAAEGRRQNPPAGNPQQPSQQTPTQPPADQPASQQQTQQPPTIRTGINYVRVDAIVTDKDGKPVLDLTQDDFTVSEDGKPQRVDSFSVVKLDVAETTENAPPRAIRSDYDEEREAARPDVRLFVILLDDYHVKRGNDLAVKKPLIDFIQNQLGPADMLAIMYPLTPIEDIRFSRDRDGAISAIEHFEGRKFDYRPRNQLEEKYAMYPAQTVERVRNQITMDALKAAGFRMGALREGRKSIIFVSEGFMSLLPSQLSDPVASMPGYGNPNRGNAGAVQATPQQQMMADVDMLSDMNRMYGDLNRQNTSVYPVDPRGLAPFEYDVNQGIGLQQDAKSLRETLDSLHSLAANTDGRAIVDRNDLATGMKQIIRDSSGYYLLGYNSTQAPMDGKFHAIKVSVKRRGLDVRARKGYWAYTADDVARAESRKKTEVATPVTTALTDLAAPLRDRTAHFWIGTSRAADGKTKVTFVWEPAAAVPGQPHDRSGRPSRVPWETARGRRAIRQRGIGNLRRGAGSTQLEDDRRRVARPGHRLGESRGDGTRFLDRHDVVRDPARLPCAHVAGTAGHQEQSRRASHKRTRVQPQRSLVHPRRGVRPRRHDAAGDRAAAQPIGPVDGGSPRPAAPGKTLGNRVAPLGLRRRRIPHRARRQIRRGQHRAGAHRLSDKSLNQIPRADCRMPIY